MRFLRKTRKRTAQSVNALLKRYVRDQRAQNLFETYREHRAKERNQINEQQVIFMSSNSRNVKTAQTEYEV